MESILGCHLVEHNLQSYRIDVWPAQVETARNLGNKREANVVLPMSRKIYFLDSLIRWEGQDCDLRHANKQMHQQHSQFSNDTDICKSPLNVGFLLLFFTIKLRQRKNNSSHQGLGQH